MANKNSSKGFNDKANEFLGIIVFAMILVAIILYIVYKFITEILIPVLIVLFFAGVALIGTVLLVRILAHLFAYLTLEKRCRRKIAVLSENISQLDEYLSATIQRGLAGDAELQRRSVRREELIAQRQNAATALADHLADKLDKVNRSQSRLSRKVARHANDKLLQKLERKNNEAALLEVEIERLKSEYDIEPDPAFERKERKYPRLSSFDRFVSSRFNRTQDHAWQ